MPILFGPILAQAVTLSVGDRTEGRLVSAPAYQTAINPTQAQPASDSKQYQASTNPNIALGTRWKHLSLTLGDGAAITLAPLDTEPRYLTAFNTAFLGISYRLQRTTLSFAQTFGYGSVNFVTQALAAPGPLGVAVPTPVNSTPAAPAAPVPPGTVVGAGGAPTGAMTPGGGVSANQLPAQQNQIVRLWNSTTSVGIAHALSPAKHIGAEFAYLIGGGTRAQDRQLYPLSQGPRLAGVFGDRIDAQNEFVTTAGVQHSSSEATTTRAGTRLAAQSVWLASVTQGLTHRFSAHSSASAAVGASISRTPVDFGPQAYTVYPTASASFLASQFLQRGLLSFSASTAVAPALDPVTQKFDPRFSFGLGAGWARDRFFSALAASTALSVDNNEDAGALRAVSASAFVGYRLATALSADAGVRTAYQLYQGNSVIPFTYGVFVGITLAFGTTLR